MKKSISAWRKRNPEYWKKENPDKVRARICKYHSTPKGKRAVALAVKKYRERKKAERIKDYSDFLQNIIQEFHKSRV